MIVIRGPITFRFNFELPKDANENLNHEIKFIIKSNESLAENKIRNKIEQLLLKYKHGSNIHEHRKQQNEWTTKICFWLVTKIRLKKFKQTCCTSKFIYLLHVEKYKKTVKNNKLKVITLTWIDEF